ncbi:hypothetical protein [Roseibacillus ishigakijimensis]|uniref:Uncharacterized protein n=1 Tax=Roseibacillus ishigakijimensis TaxID=454146 RepID=A0A934RMU4_9BACT|nr:hypothetical protein [Roseibacillus ishigakijimensis]MBK1832557.1 hypothetical protein [Roseibacillus ishigakijimensis]
MITENHKTILEEVRSLKEANAARHDFKVTQIIAEAKKRQAKSDRVIIPLASKHPTHSSGPSAS